MTLRFPRGLRAATAAATLMAVAVLTVVPEPAAAHGDEARLSPGIQAQLADARRATARFHHFGAAQQAGYGPGPVVDLQGNTCIDQPGRGAMGVHFTNGSLFNTWLDERTPQVLIYEPQPGGGLRLVGVEYLVFKAAWEGARSADPTLPVQPRLFGRAFHLSDEKNRYGLPPFYALHVWLWQPNPNGLFDDWNPSVRCP